MKYYTNKWHTIYRSYCNFGLVVERYYPFPKGEQHWECIIGKTYILEHNWQHDEDDLKEFTEGYYRERKQKWECIVFGKYNWEHDKDDLREITKEEAFLELI